MTDWKVKAYNLWTSTSGVFTHMDYDIKLMAEALEQAEAEGFRRGMNAAAQLLEDTRFDKPGREAEWSRFCARQIRALADERKG